MASTSIELLNHSYESAKQSGFKDKGSLSTFVQAALSTRKSATERRTEKMDKYKSKVISAFGSLDAFKTQMGADSVAFREPKTVYDLMNERNQRLSAMYVLKQRGLLSPQEFASNVVVIRRLYLDMVEDRALSTCQEIIAKPSAKTDEIKKYVQMTKEVLQGNTSSITSSIHPVINPVTASGAAKALVSTQQTLQASGNSEFDKEASDCAQDANNISNNLTRNKSVHLSNNGDFVEAKTYAIEKVTEIQKRLETENLSTEEASKLRCEIDFYNEIIEMGLPLLVHMVDGEIEYALDPTSAISDDSMEFAENLISKLDVEIKNGEAIFANEEEQDMYGSIVNACIDLLTQEQENNAAEQIIDDLVNTSMERLGLSPEHEDESVMERKPTNVTPFS